MTAQELCLTGYAYACQVADAVNGEEQRVMAIIMLVFTAIGVWLAWSITHH